MNDTTSMNILLADDDKDDCLFFKDAVEELAFAASLTIMHDGEQLMQHLESVAADIPDVLFLDLNMPRKNGFECLSEIKKHATLKKLPVVVYSTSYDQRNADRLYKSGAHCYICKPSDFEELKKAVHLAITLVKQNDEQASRKDFLITKLKTVL